MLSHLIKLATNPGDIVFDPFIGVGSTGVAALQLHRQFIGVEIDPLYFKAASKRLQVVTPVLLLDAIEATQVSTLNEEEEPTPEEPEELRLFEAL